MTKRELIEALENLDVDDECEVVFYSTTDLFFKLRKVDVIDGDEYEPGTGKLVYLN